MTTSTPITPEPALTFDAEAHAYRLGDRRLPSVTQVLGAVWLIEDEWYTEESRVRGRYVHKATMFEEREGLDDSSIDGRLAGYITAYRAFIRDVRPGPCILLEQPLADPVLGYAGTEDQLRPMFNSLGLIDHKTGSEAPWHPIQTGAYDRLVQVYDPSLPPRKRYVLYLRKDGTYRLIEHTDRTDFKIFQAALTLAQFKERR